MKPNHNVKDKNKGDSIRILFLLFFLSFVLFFLNGCTYIHEPKQTMLESNQSTTRITSQDTLETENPSTPDSQNKKENTDSFSKKNTLVVTVNNKQFYGHLIENKTTLAFKKKLPLTLEMADLHQNEKFYYFENELPTTNEPVTTIEKGDLMLYGADCLVLFYQDFSTSYSYTSLAKIHDPEELEKALGKGKITVTFALE